MHGLTRWLAKVYVQTISGGPEVAESARTMEWKGWNTGTCTSSLLCIEISFNAKENSCTLFQILHVVCLHSAS